MALIQFITNALPLLFLIAGGSTVVFAADSADGPEIVTDYTSFGRRLSTKETVKTLELLALQTEGNFRRIHTCTSSYDIVDRSYFSSGFSSIPRQFQKALQDDASIGKYLKEGDLPVGDGLSQGRWTVDSGSVKFFWNVDEDKVHSVYHHADWLGFVDAKSGEQRRVRIAPYPVYWTITPDSVLEFDSHEMSGSLTSPGSTDRDQEVIGPVIYRRTFKEARRQNARLMDVRQLFSFGGMMPWETCNEIIQGLDADSPDNPKGSHEFASNIFLFATDQSPPVITLVKNYSETKQSILVFDGACGSNVTSYTHVSDDRVKIRDVIEYKKREDVFFPQSISLKHFQKRGDRVSLDFYRSFNLQDLEINSPIEDSSFTLAAYPVPHGTRMLDEIRDELSVFDEKKNLFVPISNSE